MDRRVAELLNLCTTPRLREAATACLRSGMSVESVIALIKSRRTA